MPLMTLERRAEVDARIDPLLADMTLEEKAGQLNQYAGGSAITGPTLNTPAADAVLREVREGRVGSFLNIVGVENVKRLQRVAVEESRLRIPLIFGFDVIHGYFTSFPIPLAEAATWDLGLIEQSARIAAAEAACDGVHWTFAPMVDVGRDARWGRVAEGAGEDTFLGAAMAASRVRGFQGTDLRDPESIAACAKHFAAYGWAEAGRDYNTADLSEHTLRNVVLPPFKAAVDAGVATVMNGFNEVAGVPCTAHAWLNSQVLKKEWGFEGFMVSDYNSYAELVAHGYALDLRDAARLGLLAGSDMDMQGMAVGPHAPSLVREGLLPEDRLNDAVRRVLRVKCLLGLFDDPYRGISHERRARTRLRAEHRAVSRDVSAASLVLLKNDRGLLPLDSGTSRIAVVGELARSRADMKGCWPACAESELMVSLLDGLETYRTRGTDIAFAPGCNLDGIASDESMREAVEVARGASVVLLALGEHAGMSGECQSRVAPELPGDQLALARAVRDTGTPVVVVVFGGRPLVIPELSAEHDTILMAWSGGQEAGHALCDVLFGARSPQGRLPASFPRATGQLPLYYAHKGTGRPLVDKDGFGSRYRDCPNSPLFPFGHGLTYATFTYDQRSVEPRTMPRDGNVSVSVTLANKGGMVATETVQLYVRDITASVTRPVRELKSFAKVTLKPGEERRVELVLREEDLAFWTASGRWEAEPGEFEVFVGGSADAPLAGRFVLA